jgi:hypothetical protein
MFPAASISHPRMFFPFPPHIEHPVPTALTRISQGAAQENVDKNMRIPRLRGWSRFFFFPNHEPARLFTAAGLEQIPEPDQGLPAAFIFNQAGLIFKGGEFHGIHRRKGDFLFGLSAGIICLFG